MDEARRLLRHHFGHPDFRPAQLPVVQSVLAGRDTLAVLPTGGGKSVCFQIPALLSGGLTLVVSPRIALMQEQVTAAVARGIPAAALHSSLREYIAGPTVELLSQFDVTDIETTVRTLNAITRRAAERLAASGQ